MTDRSIGNGWTRYTTAHPFAVDRSVEQVDLGPGLPSLDRRLIGDVDGNRVLDLGCGMGHGAVALARRGARVIALDTDSEQIAHARRLAEQHAVKIELRHGDLADLAFIQSASVDLVVSVYALAAVEDLDRVFRQVHRILQPTAPLLITLPHPFTTLVRAAGDGTLRIERPFTSRAPLGEGPMLTYPHQLAELHTSLTRANFRVDVVLEPDADPRAVVQTVGHGWLPSTLVLRARKEGI